MTYLTEILLIWQVSCAGVWDLERDCASDIGSGVNDVSDRDFIDLHHGHDFSGVHESDIWRYGDEVGVECHVNDRVLTDFEGDVLDLRVLVVEFQTVDTDDDAGNVLDDKIVVVGKSSLISLQFLDQNV